LYLFVFIVYLFYFYLFFIYIYIIYTALGEFRLFCGFRGFRFLGRPVVVITTARLLSISLVMRIIAIFVFIFNCDVDTMTAAVKLCRRRWFQGCRQL